MESKLKIESKKPQLLYKLFLRGYKSNTTTTINNSSCFDSNAISCLAFNKLSQRHQNMNYKRLDKEQQELRYTKRQRLPDEEETELPGPKPPNVEIVELTQSPHLTDLGKVDENVKTDNHLLNLKWTCETLDKRREQITRYLQSQILKQRSESEEKNQPVNNVNYCNYNNNNDIDYNHQASGSDSPSTEPIYAEICSDHYCSSISSFDQESFEDSGTEFHDGPHEEELTREETDHLYENIDIVRHELILLQTNKSYLYPIEQDDEDEQAIVSYQTGGTNLDPEELLTTSMAEQKKGDIDEESIIENKPAIKHYWESKMRENAATQFARSNFGVQSSTIIDKINDEIRDDYMRNLELLQDEGLPRSSASDTSDEPIEFDSFDMASSSNNSSPFGQPHDTSSPLLNESPTLIDSGHQSQESQLVDVDDEEDHHDEKDELNSVHTQDQNSFNGTITNNNNQVLSQGQKKPLSHSYSYGSYTGIPKLGQQTQQQGKYGKIVPNVGGYRSIVESNRQTVPSHGKIENHVTHYITFNKPLSIKVKPIDDPSSTTTPAPLEREKSPPKEVQAKEIVEEKLTVSIKPTQESGGLTTATTVKSPKADISYMLATSRLKKEIEDNLKRERELKDQGRVRTLSVDTVQSPTPPPTPSQVASQFETSQQVEPKYVQSPKKPQLERQKSEEPPRTNQKNKNEESLPSKEIEKPLVNSIVEQTPVNSDVTPVPQPKSPSATSTYPNFKIGKNFNSLERYIMYSSMTKLNFRSIPPAWSSPSMTVTNGGTSPNADTNANFELDDAQNGEGHSTNHKNKHFQALIEIAPVEEVEPAEKVRKNYIPAEKRIKDELLEMVQREEELKQTRQQWKSTPNLSNLNLSDDEDETRAEETVETVQHRQNQVPEKRWEKNIRRRSALISKWEDMISRNNPQ